MFLVRVAEGYLVKYISIKKHVVDPICFRTKKVSRWTAKRKCNWCELPHTYLGYFYVPLQKYKTTKFNGTKDLEVKAYVKNGIVPGTAYCAVCLVIKLPGV